MEITVVTIFPQMILSYLDYGIIGRAANNGTISVKALDLREFAVDRYGHIDDGIFGQGKGMLYRVEPLAEAVRKLKKTSPESKVIYLSPKGRKLDNKMARALSAEKGLILITARYEGIDQRAVELLVDEEISVGDYVLTNGELPSLILIDAVSRFVEGAIKDESANDESFEHGLLEYDHYTEPLSFEGLEVPEVLRSGHRGRIDDYRRFSSYKNTYFNRLDLLLDYQPSILYGETRDVLKRQKRKNKVLSQYLRDIEKITKEWKDVRRSKENQ